MSSEHLPSEYAVRHMTVVSVMPYMLISCVRRSTVLLHTMA